MDPSLYPRAYFMGGGGSNYVDYSDDPGWNLTAVVLRSYLPVGSTLLEVGCATGWFVRAALQWGMDAQGVDLSEWAVANPAPGTQGRLRQCSVIDLPVHERYDAVVSWEMLEHIPEEHVPAALERLANATTNDGLMVHRIALDDASHDHHAHDDETHFTVKSRDWWLERFEQIPGLTRVPRVEDDLDRAFEGRDWQGRFFAYRVR